jgi:uncharacterized protein YndB with AHSA1/START domain
MTTTLQGALRPDADRLAVHFERRYPATPAEVWSAITEPDRVARWLAPLTMVAEDRYRLDFGDDHATTGEVLRCDAPHALVVTWDFPGEPTSRVDVEVRPDGDGALLVLDHTRLPLDQGAGYGAGWEAHLAGLEALVSDAPAPDWDERFAALLPAYREAAAAANDVRAGSASA